MVHLAESEGPYPTGGTFPYEDEWQLSHVSWEPLLGARGCGGPRGFV